MGTSTVVLTRSEIAKTLRCSPHHITRITQGKIPGVPPLPIFRIGIRMLVMAEKFEAWLKELERRENEAQRASGLTPLSLDEPEYWGGA